MKIKNENPVLVQEEDLDSQYTDIHYITGLDKNTKSQFTIEFISDLDSIIGCLNHDKEKYLLYRINFISYKDNKITLFIIFENNPSSKSVIISNLLEYKKITPNIEEMKIIVNRYKDTSN